MNAIVPITAASTNVDTYRASTDAATLCKEIVVATASNIQGKRYVCVEGWQAIAVAHGCAASARDVERVDGGVRAIGEVRRMCDGAVIAEAEGFVGEDEPTWFGGQSRGKTLPKRADYAIRAMAQTRAISRACRSAFAHVVVMMNAGLSTTPAEEVPAGGFDDRTDAQEPRQAAPRASVVLISDDQRNVLMTLATQAGVAAPTLLEKCKVRSLADLPADKYEPVRLWLSGKLGGKPAEPELTPIADILDDEIPY